MSEQNNTTNRNAAVAIRPSPAGDGRCHGFSLQNVTWGYRHIFEQAIDQLFAEGRIGPNKKKVTESFFNILKLADQSCFDHVLRQFLGALTPSNRWIMDLPGLFSDLTELGAAMAAIKIHFGMRFFETLANGGMGDSPQQMRDCLTWTRRLMEIAPDLAAAFLDGYRRLAERLNPAEMELYIEAAVKIHSNNPKSGCAFLRGELNTSEAYILSLTRECRLCDVRGQMRSLLLALTGNEFEIEDLSKLDSDDLMQRGTHVLSLEKHLYAPARVRLSDDFSRNRDWYLLMCVAAAGMILENCFPRIHGRPGYGSCSELAGGGAARMNLFMIVEYIRALRGVARRWPGARRLVARGVNEIFPPASRLGDAEKLLRDALDETHDNECLRALRKTADESRNCFATAQSANDSLARLALEKYPGLDSDILRPSLFMSDFCFPVEFSNPPRDSLVADLKKAARPRRRSQDKEDEARGRDASESPEAGQDNDKPAEACFLYDEWDFPQNDYRPDWCRLKQMRIEPGESRPLPFPCLDQAARARAVFERLRPVLAKREKNLENGDDINIDRLIAHVVERRRQPRPPMRFYEKPLVNRRDLAILILVDASGSTGERLSDKTRVIDVEKQAAVILAAGLAAIGDRFAVCGFSSNGREHCEYYMFKNFDDSWNAGAEARVMSAWPRGSTRIGPALRHSGFLLSNVPSRQRLIVLITDGKPMDQDYDPHTRYAQRDVRMACEENERKDIHTFAISTEENSPADMDIMFPRRRFAILRDIGSLPDVLPGLYLRLTL